MHPPEGVEQEYADEIDQQYQNQRKEPVQDLFGTLVPGADVLHVVALFLVAPGVGQGICVSDGLAETPVDDVIRHGENGHRSQIQIHAHNGFGPQKQLIEGKKQDEIQNQYKKSAQFGMYFQGRTTFPMYFQKNKFDYVFPMCVGIT